MEIETLTWAAIVVCITQSAMFSGLNLAFFSLSRLRLEIEAESGNRSAAKVLVLRRDPNLVLTTVLLGNVAVNVLLTLLSDSVLTGVSAFVFSTLIITGLGEILPQAYFSRNALRVTSLLSPIFHVYRVFLYPVAKPVAVLLDRWLGDEGISYFRERQMRHLIRKHIEATEADIDRIEGLGALNFLALDDLPVVQEGEPLNPRSIVQLPFVDGRPVFPQYAPARDDPFLRSLQSSGEKWVLITDAADRPRMVIDADGFLRDAVFSAVAVNPAKYCHQPIVVTDPNEKLGAILSRWRAKPAYPGDNVIDNDLILLWNESKRVITGADVLGRLLQGIAVN